HALAQRLRTPRRSLTSSPTPQSFTMAAVTMHVEKEKRGEARGLAASVWSGDGGEFYQITQRLSVGRTIASPSLQPNACANAGTFDSGPFTRNLGIGCGSTLISSRAVSGRMFVAQPN